MKQVKSTPMKTTIKCSCLSIVIALFLTTSYCDAQNQPDSLTYYIETNDGNIFTGKILDRDSMNILFNVDKYGELNILISEIKEMHPLDIKKLKGDKYWYDNPQSSRYFFSTNGYGLKKGEGYYQNVWVLFNSFSVGLNNFISIGGGIVPLFLFAGAPTPIWFTPKFSIPISKDKVNLGAGALIGTVLGEDYTGFGILYGIATLGSRDKNVSLGLGYGYAGGDWVKSPVINLNTMLRTGPKGYFISENYFIITAETTALIFSFGGRSIIKKVGLDYGLIVPIISDMGQFIAIPWLGITIPFGNK
jgi:hypothetical protein